MQKAAISNADSADSAVTTNEFGQPVGRKIADWNGIKAPLADTITGEYCRLESLNESKHAQHLFTAFGKSDGSLWTYLSFPGPFMEIDKFATSVIKPLKHAEDEQTCKPYAIIVNSKAVGIITFLRINPVHGSIEIGNVIFSPELQRTIPATEAVYLMAKHTMTELNYRRLEWKCDSLNMKSRKAATRYGFQFEGIFRNAIVYKQRNRDTAWFSITQREWSQKDGIQARFLKWLGKDNFDSGGIQKLKLQDCIA